MHDSYGELNKKAVNNAHLLIRLGAYVRANKAASGSLPAPMSSSRHSFLPPVIKLLKNATFILPKIIKSS